MVIDDSRNKSTHGRRCFEAFGGGGRNDGCARSATNDDDARFGLGRPNKKCELGFGFAPPDMTPAIVVGGHTLPTGPKVPETSGVP